MIFEDKKYPRYPTMEQVFELADSLAKEGDKSKCEQFLKGYAEFIIKASENVTNYEQALNIAKSNLGYFAGYYDRETYDRINKTYGAIHPIFKANPFDITPEEAYHIGLEMGRNS